MKKMKIVALAVGVVFFSQAAGAQWTASQRLTWTSGWSEYPAIAVDSSGNVHVVWRDEKPDTYVVLYTRSLDGGGTWQPIQRLTWTGSSSNPSVAVPSVAVDSLGRVHVVWCYDSPGNMEIYYKGSTDGGATWGPSKRLTWTSGSSGLPAIAVDSFGSIHVAWSDDTYAGYEIYYKRSTDGGTTWTPNRRLTWTADNSYLGDMAVDALGNPHLVWEDYTTVDDEIYHKRGINGGLSWATSQRLTWNAGFSAYADIAWEPSGHLQLVWEDQTPGNAEIYYKRSPDLGLNWETSQRLTWNSGPSYFPAIAADPDGNLHAVWQNDVSGDSEILYKKSPDNGTSWFAVQRLTWTSNGSQNPAIAADSSGNLHLVWQADTTESTDIYYKKSIK